MASTMIKSRRKRQHQDFALNIVPVLDCFTILVAFMLASGTYVAIGALEVSVAAEGPEAAPSTPPPANLTVSVREGGSISFKVEGESPSEQTFPAREGGRSDLAALSQALAEARTRWPKVKTVTLITGAEVPYQTMVRVLEATRVSHPEIAVGGF